MSANIFCDVVILPNPTLKDAAIAKSRELSEQGSYFTLGGETCVPHVSLYMLQLAVPDLAKAKRVLSKIASETVPLHLEAYRPYRSSGYVDVEYQRFNKFDSLQMDVVDALNSLRNGMYVDEIKRMETAEGLKLENLQQYGYQNIGELFRPHMTFTRLTPGVAFKIDDVTRFSGMFPGLGIFELGDNGTCARSIEIFEFAS